MAENIKIRIRFPRLEAKLVNAVLTAIMAIISESIVNAFGSEIDTLVSQIVSAMTGYVGPHPWAWVILFLSIFGTIFLVSCPFIALRVIVLHATVNRYDLLLRADNSLLTLLASLGLSSTDHEKQKQRILEEVLRDGMAHWNESVNSAVVLLPDDTGQYLHYHIYYRMDSERIQENMQFYIGPDSSKIKERGVAGTVYHSGKAMVGHMNKMGGRWICDLESYRDHHADGIIGRHPLYQSFICVPIRGIIEGDANGCLGVIWLDSKEKNVFDSDDVEIVLNELARRMAVAIVVCDKYRATRSRKAELDS